MKIFINPTLLKSNYINVEEAYSCLTINPLVVLKTVFLIDEQKYKCD